MSLVKSFAIGNGDMYYIRHGSDNFTVIDCCIPEDREGSILIELKTQSKDKSIKRLISTHPDQDHISGLRALDDAMRIVNFYVVKNNASKSPETADFKRYKKLRDGEHAFYIYRHCTRRWMNKKGDGRGSAGINILWPNTNDPDFESALDDAEKGLPPNNISCIVKYSLEDGATFLWMGDLETDFMEKLEKKISMPKVDVLFAPHHGRDSGKVPPKWLSQMDPNLIVIGEAPSEYLNYYTGWNIITQNSSGDVLFECSGDTVHLYVSDSAYQVEFLEDDGLDHKQGLYYIGSLTR